MISTKIGIIFAINRNQLSFVIEIVFKELSFSSDYSLVNPLENRNDIL